MGSLKERTSFWALAVLLGLLAAASTYAAPAESGTSSAQALTLDAYLNEVRAKHEGLRGAVEAAEGARLRSEEGSLLLAPTLTASANYLKDEKPNALFQALRSSSVNTYSLGLSKTFGLTGTTAKISYNLISYDYQFQGASPGLSAFYESRPAIEITQPLLRNFLGWETRANQRVLEASQLAAHHQNNHNVRLLLAQAETTYWRLSLARRNLAIQQEGLDRAIKLQEWSQKRANLQLADQSDLLQAQANLDMRKLLIQSARDEVRAASLAFNQSRSIASDVVSEKTVELEDNRLEDIKVPARAEMREDLLAAQQQEIAAIGRAEIGLSTESPTLEVYGSYALNGQQPAKSDAVRDSFRNTLPTQAIGIRFSAPLDVPTILDARSGYKKDRAAAELNYQRRAFEVEREWTELNERFTEARRRLELARSMEEIQRKKLTYERDRLSRGRTTLYQVLLFEQDFRQAQLARLQNQAEVLQIVAQLRLFAPSESEKGN